MRRRWSIVAAAASLLALCPLLLRADLPDWVRHVERDGALQEVFFRPVGVPKGAVLARRPSRETRAALSALLQNNPSDARLYALRAHEAERQLDFGAAEADWKRFAESSENQVEGWRGLADFYHRRLRPAAEVDALSVLARLPLREEERLQPPQRQIAWKTFEETLQLVEVHRLPRDLASRQYGAWIVCYPNQPEIYSHFFEHLLRGNEFGEAEQLIGRYGQQFPGDSVFPVKARAALIRKSQSMDDMFAFYKEAFEPHWPLELIGHYFSALEAQVAPQAILDRLVAAVGETPNELRPVAKLFYYHLRRGDPAAARLVLASFRDRRDLEGTVWAAAELLAAARLFGTIRDDTSAGAYSFAAYRLPGATEGEKEHGLAGLIESMISALGDSPAVVAGADPFELDPAILLNDPDFANQVASLLSRRASAEPLPSDGAGESVILRLAPLGELLAQLDTEFPRSERRAMLHRTLLEKYGARLAAGHVVRLGENFLASFETSPHRVQAILVLGDGYARSGRLEDEWGLYGRALQELAPETGSVPLGDAYAKDVEDTGVAYLQGYARILDRYVTRLAAAGFQNRVTGLFRELLERHAGDPGLYARFAAFLQKNRLDAELEQLYRRTVQRFQNAGSYLALVRWHQKQQNAAAVQDLSREAIALLSPADVEVYLEGLSASGRLGPAVAAQLYAQAFERFPFHLAFARRLLAAYQQGASRDYAAWERILRQYWFYDDGLRSQFIESLTRGGRLKQETDEARAALPLASAGRWQQLARENPAAARFFAETELAASHFESAVPLLLALANEFPADAPLAERASSALQAIALANPLYIYIVLGIEEGLHYAEPRDLNRLAHLGNIWADRQQFERAATYWEQMAQIEPGRAESYLEAAAAFSHYRLFDEALRLLRQGRAQFPGESGLYAYEMGAIYERKGDYVSAFAHYLQGVLAGRESSPCRERIVALARHPQHRDLVWQSLTQLTSGQNPALTAVMLEVEVLDAEGNRAEIERMLSGVIEGTDSTGLLEGISHLASSRGMERMALQARQRQIRLAETSSDRIRLQLALLRRHLNAGDRVAAERSRDQLYREHRKEFAGAQEAADSFWQAQQFDEAYETLAAAARDAYPQLAEQETLLAAQGAAAAGGHGQARRLLLGLLAGDPSNLAYLSAISDSYARQADREGLLLFQRAQIVETGKNARSEAEKTQRLAALERSTIASLTRLGDYSGALDRYIELMEHESNGSSVAEAVRYAARHGLTARLMDHYAEGSSADSAQHALIAARLRDLLGEEFPPAATSDAESVRLAVLQPEELPAPPPSAKPPTAPQTAGLSRPNGGAEAALRPSVAEDGIYCIQIAAYKELARATRLAAELQRLGYPARADSSAGFDRVLVGDFKTWRDAAAMEQQLQSDGYETWLRFVPAYERTAAR